MKKILTLLIFTSQFLLAQTPCVGGFAGAYPCNGIDLQSYLSFSQMGGASTGNDSWGWTDPDTGKEYALIGLNNGTAFIDISDPVNPIYLGKLPTYTFNSTWRDIKTYNNYAFVVSEASGHGMQIFDLKRLASVSSPPVTFTEDAHYSGFGNAHNIVINEVTGYAYAVGTATFSGGPHFVDISNPLNPTAAGGFSADGYSHDAQVVSYFGPDSEYTGKEIYIGSNEDKVSIVDVTDKNTPIPIATISYSQYNYTHQGWFTEDQRYFLLGDELDEQGVGFNTRTIVFDLSDLDNPQEHLQYFGPTLAIDHNGYVRGNRFYLSNYRAGIRILRTEGLYDPSPSLTEVNFFDTYPSSNSASFSGVWNIYPYLESGNLIISDYSRGFFLVKDSNYDNIAPVVNCQSITITLNASGEAIANPIDVDNGSTDNFGIVTRTLNKTNFTCEDLGDNTVEYTVADDYGNASTCTVTITVQAMESTYASGAWDITPTEGARVIFSDNFNTTDQASIKACACEIETGNTVTVTAGNYLDITNDIIVDGTLEILHEGSLVQRQDNAMVSNNGSIRVEKITTPLNDRSFTILGSPMSNETRENVYNTASLVRYHDTNLFNPNPEVASDFPLAENFADDNGDNWINYTGVLSIGEGYLVKPFAIGESGGTYTTNYSEGTLNNGVISRTMIFGDDQNDSPNILANPYASAIDAYTFIQENDLVDAVYFWEHIEDPSINYPGYNASNYDMGDISMYNLSGGISASNEQTGGPIAKPSNQYIPSGQGFAVKVNAAGTVLFNNSMRIVSNNYGYRDVQEQVNRLYINVSNHTYKLKSGTLITFTEHATNQYDEKYDAKRLATPLSIYSLNNGKELGIQGRSTFQENQEVPLGFSTQIEELQEYTISISDIEGDGISSVYLYDKLLNTVTNLSEENYEFSTSAEDYKERFTLFFNENSILELSEYLQDIYLYPNPANQEITIVSSGNTINDLKIFDIRGRIVEFNSTFDQENFIIDISTLTPAIYLVKITTNAGTIVKRIIKN